MADGKIKISELDEALQINNDAKFPYSQDNGGTDATFGAPITQIARKVTEGVDYTNLKTSNKKVVGAINQTLNNFAEEYDTTETYNTGDPALHDGTLYKCNSNNVTGAWDSTKWDEAKAVEFGGGGGGTTDYEDLSNKPLVNSVELVGNKSLDDLGIMPSSLSNTASGSIVHITDGADNIPVKSLVSQIVAVESGSGEKSPTNPYTISGFDSGVVSVCGVNLWDEVWELGYISVADGQNSPSQINIRSKNYIPIKPNISLYIKANNNFYCPIIFYDKDKNFLSSVAQIQWNRTITTPENAYYMRFYMHDSYGTTYHNDISINYPSSDTQYHAYNGNTYTFTFGQTVYGGHFDNKGNLVVTHSVVDLSEISTGGTAGSGYVWYTTLSNPKTVPNTDIAPIVSEKYNAIRYNAVASTVNSIAIRDNGVLYVNNGSNTTQPSGIAVYELANPITLAITSQDIPTLLGENNIFSDTGDVDVNYYTDNSDDIVDLIKSVGTGGFQPVIYSTEEREIGVWTDGKPLYEKVFTMNQITVSSSWVNTDIDTTDIDTIASAFGIAPDGTFYSGLDGDPTTSSHTVLSLRSYATSYIVSLILQYTKISDTAGSGQWTPQGVPTHHYSEDEQIVGTWIDGSTIYEKSFVFSDGLVCAAYTWAVTTIDVDFNKVVQSEGTSDGTANVSVIAAKTSDGKLQIMNLRNTTVGVGSVTICYTKTST